MPSNSDEENQRRNRNREAARIYRSRVKDERRNMLRDLEHSQRACARLAQDKFKLNKQLQEAYERIDHAERQVRDLEYQLRQREERALTVKRPFTPPSTEMNWPEAGVVEDGELEEDHEPTPMPTF
jgi:hypothetical protein